MQRCLACRALLALAVLAMHCQRESQAQTPRIQRTDSNSMAAHAQLMDKAKLGTIDVYVIGDSITRRWGATDYPKLLAHWNQTYHGWNAANFGWGGDRVENILWRLENGELDGVTPKVFSVQAGTNNLPWTGHADATKVDEVVSGIESVVKTLQRHSPDATVILTALFPRPQNPNVQDTIAQINQRLAKLADGKKIRWVDINSQLADAQGQFLAGMSSDGIHLEMPAYEIWASELIPILEAILGPRATVDHAPPPTGDPKASKATP